MDVSRKPDLLIICDDDNSIKLITSVIGSLFEIKVCKTAEDTTQNNSFYPAVILLDYKHCSDQESCMKLEKIRNTFPNSTIILITESKSGTELIKTLKQSRAFMFINKPLVAINIFQACVVALDKYTSLISTNKLKANIKSEFDKFQLRLKQIQEKEYLFKAKMEQVNDAKNLLNSRIEEAQNFKRDLESSYNQIRKENELLAEKLEIQTRHSEILTETNQSLEAEISNLEIFPSQIILTINQFIKDQTNFYFTDHLQYVKEISLAIATELKLKPNEIKALIMAGMLHNIYEQKLPDLLALSNPFDLEDKLKLAYSKTFNKSANLLSSVDALRPYINISRQIWEHNDGSGIPRGLHEEQISVIAHIIAIGNIYHNLVYRVFPSQLPELKQNGYLIQSIALTANRHKEAIKYITKNQRWFDYQVVRIFIDLVESHELRWLIPKNDGVKIEYKYIDVNLSAEELDKNFSDLSSLIGYRPKFDAIIQDSDTNKNFEVRILHPLKIKAGMKTIFEILTISGVEAIPENHIIQAEDIKKIIQLHSADVIPEQIELLVPIYD